MPTRRQVLHAWTRQVHTLLPTVHATRAATLAAFAPGMLWGGTVTLLTVAAALPALSAAGAGCWPTTG